MHNWRKFISLFLAIIISFACFAGCEADSDDVFLNQDNKETTVPETTLSKPEQVMDWYVFSTIGVDSSEAETIFTKLGFTYLTDLQPIGTSTMNYQFFPFGIEETPVNIMVEGGKITQVTLRKLHVADGARDAYFDADALPDTWFYLGEEGYKPGTENEVGIIMFDTYIYENSYYVGVNWESRELYYFENE